MRTPTCAAGESAKVEAMKIQGISRQTAARIERTQAFKDVMAGSSPPDPGKPYVEPPREMPLDVAIRLLDSLRGVSDPQAIEAVVNAVKDVIPAHILADATKSLLGPPAAAPDGADDFTQRPPAPDPNDDDPDGTRYGTLDKSTPSQALGHDGMPVRTWSPSDRKLGFVFSDHAVLARRKPQGPSRPLRFWGS
jgi:hypothetical protein